MVTQKNKLNMKVNETIDGGAKISVPEQGKARADLNRRSIKC